MYILYHYVKQNNVITFPQVQVSLHINHHISLTGHEDSSCFIGLISVFKPYRRGRDLNLTGGVEI